MTGSNAVLPAVAPPASAEPGASSKRILVVDDDPIILKALTLKLKSKGYEVVTASDGSQALSVTRNEKPDLMLLDVNFPPDVAHGGGVPWDGFLIAQWLQRAGHARNMPVIVISGTSRADCRTRAALAGATDFFQKPIDNDRLLASIEKALHAKLEGDSDRVGTVSGG